MKHKRGSKAYFLTSVRVAGGIVLIISFGVAFWFWNKPSPSATDPKSAEPASSAYDNLSLLAQSAYVLDSKTGKPLFSKNGDSQLPLASLTKIMTAVTAVSLLPRDTVLTIASSSLKEEGDSGLFADERWRLEDLLDFTLLQSSNDGANAIAAVAGAFGKSARADSSREEFVRAMNDKALALGLTQTYFLNPTGLDETENISGGYGSARDMSVLFYHAIKTYPSLFGGTRHESREFDSLSNLKHKVKNTNTFVNAIPSLLGSKTGYTDLAGGNLTVAFDAGPDRPIVLTVLGSTEQGRFEDAEKLVWATLEYLNAN